MGLGTETDNARVRFADTHVSKRAHCASEAPIIISQDDADRVPANTICFMFSGLASRARSCRICLFSFISLCSTGQAERPTSPLCGPGSGFSNFALPTAAPALPLRTFLVPNNMWCLQLINADEVSVHGYLIALR